MSFIDIDEMVAGYLEAAEWAEMFRGHDANDDDEERPFDEVASERGAEWSAEARGQAAADCAAFVEAALAAHGPEVFNPAGVRMRGDHSFSEQVGHDFWLTRKGHGAGFWDGDYPRAIVGREQGDLLTEVAGRFGDDVYPWLDVDNLIQFD